MPRCARVRRRSSGVPDGYLNTASIGLPPAARRTPSPRPCGLARPAGPAHRRSTAPSRPPAPRSPRCAGSRRSGGDAGRRCRRWSGCSRRACPDGARVLVAEGEFTSVTLPVRGPAAGASPSTEAPRRAGGARAATRRRRRVSVVQSADGRIVDLDALRAARAAGTRVVLDATQSLAGSTPTSPGPTPSSPPGYKWLLSPRGAAWMALHPRGVRSGLDPVPHQAGWYAGRRPWGTVYGLPPRRDGRAGLDTSPAWFCQVGAAVALPWLAGLDPAAVRAHCAGLADALRERLGLAPAGSAIVAVGRPGAAERLAAPVSWWRAGRRGAAGVPPLQHRRRRGPRGPRADAVVSRGPGTPVPRVAGRSSPASTAPAGRVDHRPQPVAAQPRRRRRSSTERHAATESVSATTSNAPAETASVTGCGGV